MKFFKIYIYIYIYIYLQVYINIKTLSNYTELRNDLQYKLVLKVDREIERFQFVLKSSHGFFIFHFF